MLFYQLESIPWNCFPCIEWTLALYLPFETGGWVDPKSSVAPILTTKMSDRKLGLKMEVQTAMMSHTRLYSTYRVHPWSWKSAPGERSFRTSIIIRLPNHGSFLVQPGCPRCSLHLVDLNRGQSFREAEHLSIPQSNGLRLNGGGGGERTTVDGLFLNHVMVTCHGCK